jgi:hypothetical protein
VGKGNEARMERTAMPSQYISVCGHSGTGKKTLISALVANDPAGLRDRFGITGTIEPFGLNFNRDLEAMYSTKADTVIHQWQFVSHAHVNRLKQHAPDARHRIILLWRPYEQQRAVIVERGNWLPFPTVEHLAWGWRAEVVPLFCNARQSGFEIELVDTSDFEYRPLTAWPT